MTLTGDVAQAIANWLRKMLTNFEEFGGRSRT
jgi:hypothetical protein